MCAWVPAAWFQQVFSSARTGALPHGGNVPDSMSGNMGCDISNVLETTHFIGALLLRPALDSCLLRLLAQLLLPPTKLLRAAPER